MIVVVCMSFPKHVLYLFNRFISQELTALHKQSLAYDWLFNDSSQSWQPRNRCFTDHKTFLVIIKHCAALWSYDHILATWQPAHIYKWLSSALELCDCHWQSSLLAAPENQWGSFQGCLRTVPSEHQGISVQEGSKTQMMNTKVGLYFFFTSI